MPRRNPDTLVDIPTTIGVISVIDTRRRANRPEGLRRPWDHMLHIPEITAFAEAFRPLFREIRQDHRSLDAFQAIYPRDSVPPRVNLSVHRKAKGVNFHASIDGTSTYTSEARWVDICTRFQAIITQHLGPDAEAYLADYEPGYYNHNDDSDPRNRCYRLYARFDAQIYFAEYQPIEAASMHFNTLHIWSGEEP